MIDSNNLAIVIPAYKATFFMEALNSIFSQSCKKFNLYIGDDNSPYDLKTIIEQCDDKSIALYYKRFDTNLGGQDLVAQWERCIAMTQGEEWIWLFSDDDVMGEDCVRDFYNQISEERNFSNLYHFNVKVIGESSNLIKKATFYPDVIEAVDFYKSKAMAKLESYVVENIFSRRIYEEIGGFVHFPLAWGSDVFTWILMMKNGGMKTITGDVVSWRYSSVNITPDKSKEISAIKAFADIDLLKKTNELFGGKMRLFNICFFFRLLVHYSKDVEMPVYNKMITLAVSSGIINTGLSLLAKIICPIIYVLNPLRVK